ncbi:hypothetical protein Hsero_0275 [Herbaspirillum seropedicae SmR1]|uniref:Uncharacterized protein n=1 Tax=Herbaspirillum seropedicae (strain SmR1) TaxID=757424 RepID=D8IW03_HERSS|nr:hypothetical protein Hsero_0275 [Herbaspirillum seropedicae SmR1]
MELEALAFKPLMPGLSTQAGAGRVRRGALADIFLSPGVTGFLLHGPCKMGMIFPHYWPPRCGNTIRTTTWRQTRLHSGHHPGDLFFG